MAKDENRLAFPDARLLTEGFFATPQGSLVNTTYVDLSGNLSLDGLCLAKATEPRFELSTTETIRLSRPGVFRNAGEVLVRDDQEGLARRETQQTDLLSDKRARALSAALQLGGTRISVKGQSVDTQTEQMTFGNDWLIYCTSILPAAEEEEAWLATFPESYTSVSRIHRPTQFAQALGAGICEHIGVTGKAAPMSGKFHGFRTVETHRTAQVVVHGPVLYVDDPYGCIAETELGWARLCSMIFVKSRTYATQNEYRFAMMSVFPEVGEVFDLPMSGSMRDCLEPVRFPVPVENAAVTISPDDSPGAVEKETARCHTYRRRTVRRQSENVGGDGSEADRTKEEIVEETVQAPFPLEKTPDVIVVHQVGTRFRLVHNAHWNEETENWRIETQPLDASTIRDTSLQEIPEEMEVPPELRLVSEVQPPIPPEYFLYLCLSPSIPRPPRNHERLKHCSFSEIEHVLACGQGLAGAVEQVPHAVREAASASAWYAHLFIQDLVSLFGPVVKSLCVIRPGVAVVGLERAPLSGAVAWATFSGLGTYTLHIQTRNVEITTFSGKSGRRAGPIKEHTYVRPLQDHGWVLKNRRQGKFVRRHS